MASKRKSPRKLNPKVASERVSALEGEPVKKKLGRPRKLAEQREITAAPIRAKGRSANRPRKMVIRLSDAEYSNLRDRAEAHQMSMANWLRQNSCSE